MSECDAIKLQASERMSKLRDFSSPEFAAKLLNFDYDTKVNTPAFLKEGCRPAAIEGTLAGTLAAVRKNGEAFSEAVYEAEERIDPAVAAKLRKATIDEKTGSIEFH